MSRSAQVHAPAGGLFALVADPHRHGELDGSGTVGDAVVGPTRLSTGDSFGMKMRMFGLPYKITSRAVGAAVLGWLGFPKRDSAGIESTLTKLQRRYPRAVDPR